MAEHYKFRFLVETGTGFGHSIYENAKYFHSAHTFEVNKETFDISVETLQTVQNARCYNMESMRGLPLVLPILNGPTLFYLDARFPGMMIGDPIDFDIPVEENVPTLRELQFLLSNRNLIHDEFIIGGLNIWEEGDFMAGRFNAREEFKDINPVAQVYGSVLKDTHYISIDHRDEGYLIIRPKQGL